jgi:hypothetical protein
MKGHHSSEELADQHFTSDKGSVSLNTYVPGSDAEKKLLRKMCVR